MKLLEVEEARATMPHSWRRHWIQLYHRRFLVYGTNSQEESGEEVIALLFPDD